MGKFVVKKAKNGKLYFQLKANNGVILMTSIMYESMAGVENGIFCIKKYVDAPIEYQIKES